MKRKELTFGTVGLLMLLLLAGGCSSLPKEERETRTSEIRNRAAEYAASGNSYLAGGNTAMAENFFVMSRDLNISIDNRKGLAESYNSLGKLYLSTGKIQTAEENFRQAEEISQELGDPELEAQCLGHRGELLLFQGEVDRALALFRQGLVLVNPKDSPGVSAVLYHNQAGALKQLNRWDEAIESVSQAIRLNEKLERYSELAANNYLMASLYSKKEDYGQAALYALKALENDKIIENTLNIGQDLYALGLIQRKAGNLSSAHDFFRRAFLVYESLGRNDRMLSTLDALEAAAAELHLEKEAAVYRDARQKLESAQQ